MCILFFVPIDKKNNISFDKHIDVKVKIVFVTELKMT